MLTKKLSDLRSGRVFELRLPAVVEPLAVLLLFLLLGRRVLAHALGLGDIGRVHLSECVHLREGKNSIKDGSNVNRLMAA